MTTTTLQHSNRFLDLTSSSCPWQECLSTHSQFFASSSKVDMASFTNVSLDSALLPLDFSSTSSSHSSRSKNLTNSTSFPLQKQPQTGPLCWLEIPVLSTTRAAAFYSAIFGWDCDTTTTTTTTNHNDTFMSESDQDQDQDPNITTPPPIQMFRCGGSTSSLRGAFIQVPEECLVQTWDAERPCMMAVLTTFSVQSIEETLEMVVEMGGRVHLSVISSCTKNIHPSSSKPYLSTLEYQDIYW